MILSGEQSLGSYRIVNVIYAGLPAPVTTGNVVAGNYIGTNAAGTAALPNGTVNDGYGAWVAIGAQGNWIGVNPIYGAPSADERNVISGNLDGGVVIANAGASNNVIAGNFIGTNATGTAAIGNDNADGVEIEDGATGNWVGVNPLGGSETSLERNVISGNASNGVELSGAGTTGNTVAGNYVGTDYTGTQAVPNEFGLRIDNGANANTIGTAGTDGANDALEGNVISGNLQSGVVLEQSVNDNVIAGNLIGTDKSGQHGLGNGVYGLYVNGSASAYLQGNVIGLPGAGNVISDNAFAPMTIVYASGTVIQGNRIGTTADGMSVIPGTFSDGIQVAESPDTQIGGTTPGAGNLISYGPWDSAYTSVYASTSGHDRLLVFSGASLRRRLPSIS